MVSDTKMSETFIFSFTKHLRTWITSLTDQNNSILHDVYSSVLLYSTQMYFFFLFIFAFYFLLKSCKDFLLFVAIPKNILKRITCIRRIVSFYVKSVSQRYMKVRILAKNLSF